MENQLEIGDNFYFIFIKGITNLILQYCNPLKYNKIKRIEKELTEIYICLNHNKTHFNDYLAPPPIFTNIVF